eukprot:gnl/MRDRNA2_/MRDRNA2_20447_c0_seq1.p1 gnl/MRDRNA2_/MRDRNA2_20447_c0~~gnl/MRDRNA2_/MRDRNA2_20447_c0_seq1.p1  ORF type:complete len:312 (+),score=52.02 gnl/MRDRNA2_/MRDRNA2_20447_c0_seq1:57-992(+)
MSAPKAPATPQISRSRSEADMAKGPGSGSPPYHPKGSRSPHKRSRDQRTGSERSERSRLSMTGSFLSGSQGRRNGSHQGSLARSFSATQSSGFMSAQELAYKEATDRHIQEMEIAAGDAIREKRQWLKYVKQCVDDERDDMERRRQMCRDNQRVVQSQMMNNEIRRQEGRKQFIESASAHEFPVFTEPPANELMERQHQQQNQMRYELDHQVRTNNTLRNLAKQRERELEANQLEANRQEMSMLRELSKVKREHEKDCLNSSWDRELRMKNVWKAIQNHSSAPPASSNQIQDLMADMGASSVPASVAGSQR